jgi:hypothetical protein
MAACGYNVSHRFETSTSVIPAGGARSAPESRDREAGDSIFDAHAYVYGASERTAQLPLGPGSPACFARSGRDDGVWVELARYLMDGLG